MALVFKIAGVDVSSSVKKGTVRITNRIGARSDEARFTMVDEFDTIRPTAGQEVLILDGAGARKFGGILAAPERIKVNANVDAYAIQAQDFGKLLEKKLVVRSFIGPTAAGDIIKTILDDFVEDPSIGQSNIQNGPNIDFIGFNHRDAKSAIQEIVKLTGFEWYIDENKELNFFPKSTTAAPFTIAEAELRFRNFRLKPDASQIRNRIIVRGGTQNSDPFVQEHKGNPNTNTIHLAYPPSGIPIVENGGIKTVGIKNIDDDTVFDFLYDENNLTLEYDALSPTSSNVKITYPVKVPILVQLEDAASISEIAAIEDSDGVYEFHIVDETIETTQAATDRAQAELDRFSRVIFSGSFETWETGFRSGQLLCISFPLKSLTVDLVITSVTFSSNGNEDGIYTVQFGSISFAFEDFLLDLFDKGRKITVRAGEVLNVLSVISEALPVGDLIDPGVFITPPFTWGPPASANRLRWGFGEWT